MGDIPEVEPEEDVDRDVEIAEEEEHRQDLRRAARRKLEDMREAGNA